jgi:integrase
MLLVSTSRRWYVREFDPASGKVSETPCDSCELADELIRGKEREWMPDPVQRELVEQVIALARTVRETNLDEAINDLIVKLGGDPGERKLVAVGWDEARRIIIEEMGQTGRSTSYLADVDRITRDFGIITGLERWSAVDLEAIRKYRRVRMAGGWDRDGRAVSAIEGRAMNKDLATLSAFFERASAHRWIRGNPLAGRKDERVKTKKIKHEYMPDADLAAIIRHAQPLWLRVFVMMTYYTGARRGDLLSLHWDDVDFEGAKSVEMGSASPRVWIRGNKADTAHWVDLSTSAVQAMRSLRLQPVVDRLVFPVRESAKPDSWVSRRVGEVCVEAGLVDEKGGNRWSLTDIRRKLTTDLRNLGASMKERQAIMGHRSESVNERHYEAVEVQRLARLIGGLRAFAV